VVVLLLGVTLTLTMNVLPSKAASHPNSHSKHATPTPAIVATPPSSASDWRMLHNNGAHSGVNTGEALLNSNTVRGLTLAWRADIGPTCSGCDLEHVVASPTVAGGIVYVEAYDDTAYQGTLYAFNELSGRLLWSYTVHTYLEASLAVVNGVVYINNYVGDLFALNAVTGQPLWSYSGVSVGVLSSPIVGGVVYIGATALNAMTGKLLWDNPDASTEGSAAVVNGVVYTVNGNGVLYALNAATGALLWTYTGGNIRVTTSPVVANGVVYKNRPECPCLQAWG
jgi:outer membrane protein assembly factor BamB